MGGISEPELSEPEFLELMNLQNVNSKPILTIPKIYSNSGSDNYASKRSNNILLFINIILLLLHQLKLTIACSQNLTHV
jgi:hypothetical protein